MAKPILAPATMQLGGTGSNIGALGSEGDSIPSQELEITGASSDKDLRGLIITR
jgi:hypothetical protein